MEPIPAINNARLQSDSVEIYEEAQLIKSHRYYQKFMIPAEAIHEDDRSSPQRYGKKRLKAEVTELSEGCSVYSELYETSDEEYDLANEVQFNDEQVASDHEDELDD